jgi:hypothetical protein
MKNRIEQRDELLTGLGLLIDPIRRLVFGDSDPAPQIPYVRSQFQQDFEAFRDEAVEFFRPAKHRFESELDTILRGTKHFSDFLGMLKYPELLSEARGKFPLHLKMVQEAIRSVPCDQRDAILPANSPFKTYFKLRSICSSAASRLDLFDPYLGPEAFHRYLSWCDENVFITVVTSEKLMVPALASSSAKNRRNRIVRDRIVAVSELLAAERPTKYRFLVTAKQHDRHLRADQSIFHLGGSIKDASREAPYTLSALDATQPNHRFLDEVIAQAVEWFGPNVRSHRTS